MVAALPGTRVPCGPWPEPPARGPLGLRPAFIFEEQQAANVRARAIEIANAIHRYAAAGKPIPEAWAIELEQRLAEEAKT